MGTLQRLDRAKLKTDVSQSNLVRSTRFFFPRVQWNGALVSDTMINRKQRTRARARTKSDFILNPEKAGSIATPVEKIHRLVSLWLTHGLLLED